MKTFLSQHLKHFARFIGPGYMVAVGYLDPGNWATDLAAGSGFGYRMLFIIFLSNIMAVLLQSLCIRLGVVTGLDLAQACSKHFSKPLSIFLYVLCEIAIIATDLAEVIGSAIALKLLFNLPLLYGVIITSLDVLVILLGWNSKRFRYFEFIIMLFVSITAFCLLTIVSKSNVKWADVLLGFLPTPDLILDSNALYVAVGIIGATVMPHNLYLHSSICKTRAVEYQLPRSDSDTALERNANNAINSSHDIEHILPLETDPLINRSRRESLPLQTIINLSMMDTIVALCFAVAINCSILIVSSANFDGKEVAELEDAFHLITSKLGSYAGILFATALLFAGQGSTITGTLAGQIVMEGIKH